MKIAYCRDCKTVIATGALAPQQVIVRHGRRRTLNTMPYHTVKGKEHRDVGLLEVPDRPLPSGKKLEEFFKDLSKEFKGKFE